MIIISVSTVLNGTCTVHINIFIVINIPYTPYKFVAQRHSQRSVVYRITHLAQNYIIIYKVHGDYTAAVNPGHQ